VSEIVEAAVYCGSILLALLIGYIAGTRRRPARHGSVQLRHQRHR
jgi:hypothetical protein